MKLPVGLNFVLDDQENFHTTWGKPSTGIWYGVFNSSGTEIKKFLFPDTQGCCSESNLALSNNNVVVVWRYVSQSFNSYIIGQVFSALQDSANKNNINFYDQFFDAERFGPTIDFFDDSTFIVAWYGEGPQTHAQRGIYGEITTTSLSGLGGNFLINDFLDNNAKAGLQKILISKDGNNFLAIWHDNRSGTDEVYGRLFDISGNAKGNSFLVSEIPENAYMFYFSGATDKVNGNYAVVWAVESKPYWQLRWRWINKDGIPLGPSERLTSENEPVMELAEADVDIDEEGKIIVVWEQEYKGVSAIFGRRFKSPNNPYGEIFKVSKSEYSYNQINPKVKLKNNRIFVLWRQYNETSSETYARIIDFYDTTLVGVEENKNTIPNDFSLSQNYPNPFNPSTNISYKLQGTSYTTLKVYDMLGREIATLVNEEQPAGTYQIVWNGMDNFGNKVTSGVYIYRIQAGDFVSSKKMILMK